MKQLQAMRSTIASRIALQCQEHNRFIISSYIDAAAAEGSLVDGLSDQNFGALAVPTPLLPGQAMVLGSIGVLESCREWLLFLVAQKQ